MVVEASKLKDDKNLAISFEAEKKVRFFFGVISHSASRAKALREITPKTLCLFFRVKKIKNCVKHGNI